MKSLEAALSVVTRLTAPTGVAHHITRYAMYTRLAQLVTSSGYEPGRALAISSGSLPSRIGLETTGIVEADYPTETIFEIRQPDCSFDAVVSDQVLEHVQGNPQAAVDECLRVVRSGGLVIHTTCMLMPVHGSPGDFWRFTPAALRLLHGERLSVIEAGAWGNRWAMTALQLGVRRVPVPHAKWHPVHRIATNSHELWPIVTWIVGTKV